MKKGSLLLVFGIIFSLLISIGLAEKDLENNTPLNLKIELTSDSIINANQVGDSYTISGKIIDVNTDELALVNKDIHIYYDLNNNGSLDSDEQTQFISATSINGEFFLSINTNKAGNYFACGVSDELSIFDNINYESSFKIIPKMILRMPNYLTYIYPYSLSDVYISGEFSNEDGESISCNKLGIYYIEDNYKAEKIASANSTSKRYFDFKFPSENFNKIGKIGIYYEDELLIEGKINDTPQINVSTILKEEYQQPNITIEGHVINYIESIPNMRVYLNDTSREISLNNDGSFIFDLTLDQGHNFINYFYGPLYSDVSNATFHHYTSYKTIDIQYEPVYDYHHKVFRNVVELNFDGSNFNEQPQTINATFYIMHKRDDYYTFEKLAGGSLVFTLIDGKYTRTRGIDPGVNYYIEFNKDDGSELGFGQCYVRPEICVISENWGGTVDQSETTISGYLAFAEERESFKIKVNGIYYDVDVDLNGNFNYDAHLNEGINNIEFELLHSEGNKSISNTITYKKIINVNDLKVVVNSPTTIYSDGSINPAIITGQIIENENGKVANVDSQINIVVDNNRNGVLDAEEYDEVTDILYSTNAENGIFSIPVNKNVYGQYIVYGESTATEVFNSNEHYSSFRIIPNLVLVKPSVLEIQTGMSGQKIIQGNVINNDNIELNKLTLNYISNGVMGEQIGCFVVSESDFGLIIDASDVDTVGDIGIFYDGILAIKGTSRSKPLILITNTIDQYQNSEIINIEGKVINKYANDSLIKVYINDEEVSNKSLDNMGNFNFNQALGNGLNSIVLEYGDTNGFHHTDEKLVCFNNLKEALFDIKYNENNTKILDNIEICFKASDIELSNNTINSKIYYINDNSLEYVYDAAFTKVNYATLINDVSGFADFYTLDFNVTKIGEYYIEILDSQNNVIEHFKASIIPRVELRSCESTINQNYIVNGLIAFPSLIDEVHYSLNNSSYQNLNVSTEGEFNKGLILQQGSNTLSFKINTKNNKYFFITYNIIYHNNVEPLTIATDTLTYGVIDENYNKAIAASGGVEPYAWNSIGLPDWLSLSQNGVISGVPVSSGDYSFSVGVTDKVGTEVIKQFNLKIKDEPSKIIVDSTQYSGDDNEIVTVTGHIENLDDTNKKLRVLFNSNSYEIDLDNAGNFTVTKSLVIGMNSLGFEYDSPGCGMYCLTLEHKVMSYYNTIKYDEANKKYSDKVDIVFNADEINITDNTIKAKIFTKDSENNKQLIEEVTFKREFSSDIGREVYRYKDFTPQSKTFYYIDFFDTNNELIAVLIYQVAPSIMLTEYPQHDEQVEMAHFKGYLAFADQQKMFSVSIDDVEGLEQSNYLTVNGENTFTLTVGDMHDFGTVELYNGQIYVPLRFFSEKLNTIVNYNSETKEITLTKNGNEIKVNSINNIMNINGEDKQLNNTLQIFNGRTYIPFREIAEEFGVKISLCDENGNFDIKIPVEAGSHLAKFTLVDKDSSSIIKELSFGYSPVSISPESLPNAKEGESYHVNFSAPGCVEPVQWGLNGELPAGLTFSEGVLAGTPTKEGVFSITILVIDNNMNMFSKIFELTIDKGDKPQIVLLKEKSAKPIFKLGDTLNIVSVGEPNCSVHATIGNIAVVLDESDSVPGYYSNKYTVVEGDNTSGNLTVYYEVDNGLNSSLIGNELIIDSVAPDITAISHNGESANDYFFKEGDTVDITLNGESGNRAWVEFEGYNLPEELVTNTDGYLMELIETEDGVYQHSFKVIKEMNFSNIELIGYLVDEAGNESTIKASNNIGFDTISPKVLIRASGKVGRNKIFIEEPTLKFISPEDSNTIYYKIGDLGSLTEYINEFKLNDGYHVIYYYSVDNVGNRNPLNGFNEYSLKVDTIGPQAATNVSIIADEEDVTNGITDSKTINIICELPIDACNVYLKLNNNIISCIKPNENLNNVLESTTNVDKDSTEVAIIPDIVAPTITAPEVVNSDTALITITDNSRVDKALVNGEDVHIFFPMPTVCHEVKLSLGENTFIVQAVDINNNYIEKVVKITRVPLQFEFTSILLPKNGENTIAINVVDEAGNESGFTTPITIIKDTVGPVFDFTTMPEGDRLVFTAIASEEIKNKPNTLEAQVRVNDEFEEWEFIKVKDNPITYSSTQTITENANIRIKLTAQDVVGNETTSTYSMKYFDPTKNNEVDFALGKFDISEGAIVGASANIRAITKNTTTPESVDIIVPPISFTAKSEGTDISNFEQPLLLMYYLGTPQELEDKNIDINKIDIYYFNEESSKWEDQNGTYHSDPQDEYYGYITLSVNHFSVYSVLSDTVPPILDIESPISDDNIVASEVTIIGKTETDAVLEINGIDYSSEISELNGTFTFAIPLTNEGNNQLLISATDNQGNKTSKTINVINDSIAPEINIVSIEFYTMNSSDTFNITVTDNNKTTTVVMVNDTEIASSTEKTIEIETFLQEGNNNIEIESEDEAGNINRLKININRDNTKPVITCDNDETTTKHSTVKISGTINEVVEWVKINGANALIQDKSYSIDNIDLTEGLNKITVSAKDLAGNIAVKEVLVEHDPTAPDLDLASIQKTTFTNQSSLTVSGNTEANSTISIYLNNVEVHSEQVNSEGEFSHVLNIIEAENSVSITVTDELDRSNTWTGKIYKDTDNPSLIVSTPNSETTVSTSSITVSGQVSDNISLAENIVTVTVNGKVASNNNGVFSLQTSLSGGANNITIIATDKAGNSTTKTITITYNKPSSGGGSSSGGGGGGGFFFGPLDEKSYTLNEEKVMLKEKEEVVDGKKTVTQNVTIGDKNIIKAFACAIQSREKVRIQLPQNPESDPEVDYKTKLTLSEVQVSRLAKTGINIIDSSGNEIHISKEVLLALKEAESSIEIETYDLPPNEVEDQMQENETVLKAKEISTAIKGETTLRFKAPKDLDQDKLMIRVVHSDGTVEEIKPTIETEKDISYLVFNVNRFSTFIVYTTETIEKEVNEIEDTQSEVVVEQDQILTLTLNSLKATINGEDYALDAAPFVKPGTVRTLVPVRFVAEGLGAEVIWNGKEQSVTIIDGKEIKLTIGEINVLVDGVEKQIDCPPEKTNRTYVPIRFISETLGAKVSYDGKTKQIAITR